MARTTTTVCLLLLLLVSTATATARVQRRDMAEEGTSPPAADSAPAEQEPPSGHLGYRIVTGLIEKATGKSARLDLEQEEKVL
ncbi:uncharacterized protein LOC123452876 [Hordeum vulgare subsp. vulgare]|uniref:Predicted protein n=1 Tax=Hordeum vulgare subsp. vulgare TaxID=112509 RepID=F2EKB9_HORVV|nr:uncharacterized protein LOC123395415 [Hordeum vulgare subsp. vulgare]XP_044985538.1 uncharacterized protein LOC123452876 [Hordeum vulgare subsp. vulgare]BAK07791.1 predicted protein [Hordeum vulgare subsp. vulgare]